MSETPFHPVVDAWFKERFGAPTEPQRLGWPEIASGRHTLIAAPTGSGKTLAAFLVCIDRLLRQGLDGSLPEFTQVVYVSPLKALSNDVRRNLEVPLAEIHAAATKAGLWLPPLRASVRTGDTPAAERAKMLKKPPHILVTTPESLFLLLTAAKSRELLGGVTTVIVDEIHALARDKRGSHLALTLERLEAVCRNKPVRIGLSATQKPIDEIGRFLVGAGRGECRIVDTGFSRELDLDVETPASALSAVCSNEQWDEVYERLVALISAHRSTLVFVNTRRMAERVSHRLRERLGEDAVASHHGSLSREIRLAAEEKLKRGELKAIVATASLELGIDVGFIDLVCQVGSPRAIATFLQRVGRSGHRLGVVPRGRLFALTRDELLESLALLRAVRAGRLDAVELPEAPIDILIQQIVAEVACQDWDEDALYERFTAAWPYRRLERAAFDRAVALASEGIAKGRKEGAYLHRDQLHKKLRARRAARLTALTSGGAIPENADYRVVTQEEGTFIGTVNEDFAIESMAGDVFLLGNTSWRVRGIRGGQVLVSDAQGAPATIPFWLGEAPGRTIELSAEVSALRADIAARPEPESAAWLKAECRVGDGPAMEAATYVHAQKAAVGFVPTQEKILFERFFDESGGMQLVIHSPYGSRINRAWGLALRKRFCRSFDFELQASADDNGIVLSLGLQHSFPVDQMFKMLNSAQAKDVLIQALLAAPMFQVRWRWNVSRALAVLRTRGGKKVPPPLQRFKSDDMLTAVFPAQTACLENRPENIEVPDHPLVQQTVHDCLHEAMDVARWEALLKEIEAGRVELVGQDTREPSPFSHSILNANPYAFLDDAPLEERRARAVATRRTVSADDMRELARLDPDAIARVRSEAWPVVRDAEELHDALLSLHVLRESEGADWRHWFDALVAEGRAARVRPASGGTLWIAAERWPLARAAYPGAAAEPALRLPPELEASPEPLEAATAIARGRLDVSGPITAPALAEALGLELSRAEGALATLEAGGSVLQGRFTPESSAKGAPVEWCERRLLARIHRLTLEGARRRVQAVPPEVFWRFLCDYHHLSPAARREGRLGLYEAVGQLQGFDLAAAAWDAEVLPGRVQKYQPEWLDTLSFSGELLWSRLRPPKRAEELEPSPSGMTRVAPISLAFRSDLPWLLPADAASRAAGAPRARAEAQSVHAALSKHGALFFDDLVELTKLPPTSVEDALSELAALGAVTSDGFSALRSLVMPARPPHGRARSRWSRPRRTAGPGGRWTLFPGRVAPVEEAERLSHWAWQLLRRYGIVFRDLLTREAAAPSWWQLVAVLRRLEARGEVLGGRYVSGVAGEQYALAEAVETLRGLGPADNKWLVISAADPLNLAGILTPGARIPATRGNRLLLRGGRLIAYHQGGETQIVGPVDDAMRERILRVLRLQVLPPRDGLLKELSEAPAASESE
ncbi:MAG: DEAD/DEAH box helicase [Elusimicrobia bacterium]|nr:DEAD/DEAH box helicase [Elusimicrobiota bacterium]